MYYHKKNPNKISILYNYISNVYCNEENDAIMCVKFPILCYIVELSNIKNTFFTRVSRYTCIHRIDMFRDVLLYLMDFCIHDVWIDSLRVICCKYSIIFSINHHSSMDVEINYM